MGLPRAIFVGLVVALVGLLVEAAVGAAEGFSEVVVPVNSNGHHGTYTPRG